MENIHTSLCSNEVYGDPKTPASSWLHFKSPDSAYPSVILQTEGQTPGSTHPLKPRGPVVWSHLPKTAIIVLLFLHMQAPVALKEWNRLLHPLALELACDCLTDSTC